MKNFFKKVWAFLNGNKTILGTALIAVLQNEKVYGAIPDPWGVVAMSAVSIFTGVGLVHHAKKGYFSSNPPKY